ncbi:MULTISPECIES: adenosylcobinamide-GDP ribazoletransferase [Pseudomonas]|uniref:Adenosylcobinamide-GDP ribazoletransferase n=1 Tax=Pseudomonas putida TaxID=303 RepID=A0A1L7N928_PSEPU|nr:MULTISPECIES: adenosylcobinamide-GDP ribazoletransferase [Pseudomonas]EKT4454030.1 adenosylcobinamide-GDP ribazoletransferase [Pseudomonas putida]EKT4564240.1 adenosylcobinamide-GDP ribazoletransferase [Pseudomonas putida]MBH3452919.1 adenosylcobinamide-GDP ribazoletransferase [Pseudomonas putida]MBP2084769.1 adenosylcobinamide-GDP ribazoletransferase [Pseudomonas sp. PvP089]MBP2089530.1 adenosylcobinamide-GDP ribazoletransferase [Pseudomonas sp. PvP088]
MLPFWIALQFLSSLPVSLPGMPEPRELGRSLLFYPLVGLLFGLLLWLASLLLQGTPAPLHAALLLTLWVLLSGALHLDGLADSADAWLGGFGDRERTLQIMKDPRSGPIAVVTLVLVLLLKFCALWVLVEQGIGAQLLLAPLIGRAAMLGLFLCTPYVRPGGLGQALAEHLPRRIAGWVLLGSALFCLVLGGWVAVLALAMFAWLRHLICRRLGGTTGDTAGAMLELLELVVVLGLALGL